jgi:anaerobic selenocysteine-containing dehydrogenase
MIKLDNRPEGVRLNPTGRKAMGEKGRIFRHVCPRNCYNTCSLVSRVEKGVIQEIRGDAAQGYSQGRMCHLAYGYLDLIYHPRRLIYPLRQEGRGTGNWQRITWEKVFRLIAEKMVELRERYGSYLPVLLYTNSGNLGLLHQAFNWLADFTGDITTTAGSLCWGAGLDAAYYDFGGPPATHPELMAEAKEIVIWGGNPAWTATLQMEYIYRAREKGARLTVIDPVFTATAALADRYIQVYPGSDGALALAALYYLWQQDLLDKTFIREKVFGWEKFEEYLRSLNIKDLADACGVDTEAIIELASIYGTRQPVATWNGFGLQRHVNGGQNVRAIHALVALSGNLRYPGGLFYASNKDSLFHRPSQRRPGAKRETRKLPVYNLAEAILKSHDPPVKMAIISRANPISQNTDTRRLAYTLQKLELVVVIENFLTPTAQLADLVLPAAMFVEYWDVVPSYWHNWIAINQPAIKPRGEARSEIAIVSGLVRKLSEMDKSFKDFPFHLEEEEWLERLFNEDLYNRLGISHYRELLEGPRLLRLNLDGNGKRYNLYSSEAKGRGFPALPIWCKPPTGSALYPYRLLTLHSLKGINSQFAEITSCELVAWIHPELARLKGLQAGRMVRIFNQWGELQVPLALSRSVPLGAIVCFNEPGRGDGLNSLIPPLPTDMGHFTCGGPGVAYHDTFVNLQQL